MQLYKVKLNDPEASQPNSHSNGYLAIEGELALYKRGEALKKAILFDGKIEKHGKNYTTVSLNVLQLAKSELSPELINELDGREVSTDTTEGGGQHLYYGDVFDAILGENWEHATVNRLSFDVAEEVTVLREMSASYAYIMLAE